MSWAITKTKEIMRNALCVFSKALNLPKSQVQIVITTYDEKERSPIYRVMSNGNPAPINGHHPDGSPNDHVNFKQILDTKIDFLNYEGIAAPFMSDALERFSKETGVPAVYLSIMLMTNDTPETPLGLQLWKYEPPAEPHRLEKYLDEENKEQTREVLNAGKQVFIRHMEFEKDLFGFDDEALQQAS